MLFEERRLYIKMMIYFCRIVSDYV